MTLSTASPAAGPAAGPDPQPSGDGLGSSPRWLTEDEAKAWRALRGLGAPLNSVLNRQLTRESGLSMADYEVLVVLSEASGSRLRARELGRLTGWEKSRLSHHITRMEARGLVTREGDSSDGRGAVVVLTPFGRETIVGAAPGHVVAVRHYVIDHLTHDQLRTLGEIGDIVQARLVEACVEIEEENCRS